MVCYNLDGRAESSATQNFLLPIHTSELRGKMLPSWNHLQPPFQRGRKYPPPDVFGCETVLFGLRVAGKVVMWGHTGERSLDRIGGAVLGNLDRE
jgi:hypothetical protein